VAQLFDFLLVRDAEPVFFVNNDQAEVFEDDIALQEPMKCNEQYRTAPEASPWIVVFTSCAERKRFKSSTRTA